MERERSYTSPEVCRMAGVTYRQLCYWVDTGLILPSVRDARGSGSQRLFSEDDVALIRAVRIVLDAGVSLHRVRLALELREVPEFVERLSEAGASLVAVAS